MDEFEFGFYDGDYGPDYGIIWFCFGFPFKTIEAAEHTGSKSTWGPTVIVRRPAGTRDLSVWELVTPETV